MPTIAVLREAGGLGDVVMTEPVLRGLRERFPDARIVYAGLPGYAGIVARFPAPPDDYLAVPRHARRGRDAPPDLLRETAYAPLAGAERIVDLFCPAFRHEREHGPATWKSRIRCFAEAAGVAADVPRVRIGDTARARAAGYLHGLGVPPETGGPLVALAPFACGRRRTWPLVHWDALAARLLRAGCRPLLLHPFAEPLRGLRGTPVTGLELPELAAVLAHAACAVTNDSGALHLAAAVKTPAVALFGSTHPDVVAGDYPQVTTLWRPESPARPAGCHPPCHSLPRWCDRAACAGGCRLLAAISPEEAAHAVRTRLVLDGRVS